MSTKIKGAEYPLSKIFSSDFDYEIPSYQRPYAWTEEEAGDLFDDLHDFYSDEPDDEQYFLGSIVLVKDEDKPHAEVIDGQQRLTTLTILLAAMAAKLDKDNKTMFSKYIIEPGNVFEGLEEKPRLHIRKKDNEFFKKYIQGMRFDELFELDPDAQDTEAKGNIIRNAKLMVTRINEHFENVSDIVSFGTFLVRRCFLVAVSTPTRQSAFRIFSVMNNRGMSLLATDIIKADVIGAISDPLRNVYNEKWEELEAELGRNGFNDLFGNIRMIKTKTKARRTLQDEFYAFVLQEINEKTAIDFIDNSLEPYSEAYRVIKESEYVAATNADKVNDILKWLNRIDNSDWVPVAMLYYTFHKNDPVLMDGFLRRLERLAAYMRANSWDVTHRIERYSRVLTEIEDRALTGFGEAIELSAEEKQEFLDRLESDIYKMVSKKRNYLILRLDSFVSDGAAAYDSKVLTIEHVLPQTIAPGSEWEKQWPDSDERSKWLHKIGNLLPLTKRHNSQAQNYEFDVKKEKYFKSKAGTTSFALASQVLSYSEWTPAIVAQRQRDLIAVYRENWDL